ncbi:membrane protein containing Glycosyl transferase, group 1 domain protein [Rhodopirellula maiorica SM1]|uniref:Membrane protein containing Glycosyl transferase, group 1 domain protein n=1 Tax=Rhodopirellula maiorica SM1 TaxID=1265738 RepID=M5R874_9BACT|nr:glycosyltransferase [Rhodopirellula maiorica]EMI15590.1 membrane protein containing Glycosyl transferase, group 1 domain protein [Rhodopirellula maiorica SM1]
MMTYLPLIIAAIVSVVLVPVVISIARRFAMMDVPDARKVHSAPTPRIGGIAIFAGGAIAIALTLLYRYLVNDPVSPATFRSLCAIGGGAFFVFLVGLVDDVRTVSSRYKLVALIGAATTVCGSGVVLSGFVFGGQVMVDFHWAEWLVTVVWLIGVSVAIGFIDGLDGLAGSLTLLSAIVVSVVLVSAGALGAAILPLALCGALIGFLIYNWHPAKTFMGDCGSMTIGFLLASSIVLANAEAGTMRGFVLPSLAISVPLLEAGLTMFRRRYLQRRSMFAAERGHIHHRLLDRGFTHPQAVVTLMLVSALAVGIGLISLSFNGWASLGGLALLVPLLWGTFQLAGSVRTDEMLHALRSKRELDRTKTRYRSTFEDMQLEFDRVKNFSGWWDAVCQSAERLDFVRLHLKMPASEGRDRDMVWETDSGLLALCERMHASIPVVVTLGDGPTASVAVEIAARDSMESAGERLALFARLMTEYSIAHQRQQERLARSRMASAGVSRREYADDPVCREASGGPFGGLRVALVHDFLYTSGGAERVVEQLINVFPQCDLFALFDFLPESKRGFLRDKPVTTSLIQRLPFASTKHRAYLPLMPIAIEQLDVSRYDLVISSSYVAAKGVITGPDQLHVCYCHSPVRYAWDLQHQYMQEAGLGFGPKGLLARWILHYIRNWDVRTSLGVDHFIANSQFVARRIRKVYRRESDVIHPPVNTDKFEVNESPRDDFYLVNGRMVPYKRTDLIVNAFRQMPDRKLVVIGEGPGFEEVRQLAGPNVTLLGYQEDEVLVDHMQRAKALIFAAEEDFGIVPVEALSCGTPVIAFGKGGATETVVDGESGVLFHEQTEESLVDAVDRFETLSDAGHFDADELHRRSLEFSEERFTTEITSAVQQWVDEKWSGGGHAAAAKIAAPVEGKELGSGELPEAELAPK